MILFTCFFLDSVLAWARALFVLWYTYPPRRRDHCSRSPRLGQLRLDRHIDDKDPWREVFCLSRCAQGAPLGMTDHRGPEL
jgi:hypothetical protein